MNSQELVTEDAKKLQQMDLDSLIMYIESDSNRIKKGVKTTQKKTTTKVS